MKEAVATAHIASTGKTPVDFVDCFFSTINYSNLVEMGVSKVGRHKSINLHSSIVSLIFLI